MKTSVLIVNWNAADFVEATLFALRRLTKHPYRVHVLDNGSGPEDWERLRRAAAQYDNVEATRRETDLRGSMAHGTALNELVAKVDTPYFSILDADALWLHRDWDDLLIGELDDRVKVIGTVRALARRKTFPNIFAAVFETEAFRRAGVDFRPKDVSLHLDTGYEMEEKYLAAGYRGKTLIALNTRTYRDGPFRDIITGEFYLEGHPHIVAAHFGRGSSLGAMKYRSTAWGRLYRVPVLGRRLLRARGLREKQAFLRIARELVLAQCPGGA